MHWKTVKNDGEAQWYLAQGQGLYVLLGRYNRASDWFVFAKDGQWDGFLPTSASDSLFNEPLYTLALQKAEEYIGERDPSF